MAESSQPSWKSSQGQGYDGSPSFQVPSSNNQFQKRNSTPSVPPRYVPPNQRKPFLEDTLQQFMQSQVITNQTQAQKYLTIRSDDTQLEVQIKQLAASIREREKGHFPNQTVPNPRG